MAYSQDSYYENYPDYYKRYRDRANEEENRLHEMMQRMRSLEKELQHLQREYSEIDSKNSFLRGEITLHQARIAMLELALFLATNSQTIADDFKKQATESISMLKKLEQ